MINHLINISKPKKEKIFFEAFSPEGRIKPTIIIEGLLKTLKPDSGYDGPAYPKDDKIAHEWVLELINRMKDMENKKSNGAKYLDKVYLLQMLLKVKNIFEAQKEALIDINIPKGEKFTVVGIFMDNFMIYCIYLK
jgi:hypothetical protein